MASWRSLLLAVCLGTTRSLGQSIVYVTDIEIYTSMARCAQSAVSYNVMSMTNSACGEAVTDLQSCICTKNGGANSAAVSKGISSSISYSCGSTASDDLSSAMVLYNGYCNQASIGSFPKPTRPVSVQITDLPAMQDLPPCAASALSYAVMSMTYDLCPEDPSLLQSCVCSKNQNSLRVSQIINSSVKYSCSPITADISVAQGVFAGYCGLGAGVTSFPVASPPPGQMTYYITALPQYSALAPCAQYGVSYGVMTNTYDLCPKDPAGLASCVCLKTGMPNIVSKIITSSVKYSCDSTATDDISSALSVWDYFCSAVKAEVSASVTESVSTAPHTGVLGGGGGSMPSQTGTSNSGGNGGNGGNGGGGSLGGSTGNPTGGNTDPERKPNIGAIVGGVVGGIAVVVLAGVAIFFCMRRKNAANAQVDQAMAQNNLLNNPPPVVAASPSGGKSELDASAVALRPGTAGSAHSGTPGIPTSISPVSASHTPELRPHGPYAPPPPMPEMPAQYAYAQQPQQPSKPELHGQEYRPELYGQQAFRPELQGQSTYYPQQPPNGAQTVFSASSMVSPQSPAGSNGWGQQVHEAPGSYHGQPPQTAELQGQQWATQGPPQYYEMPGGGAPSYAR
ncbi:uncharacterized protein B0I36DRAFT_146374 [Microdochium trichocladiopsis]|uniref:Mid2 domain-containing protein n=1 Tax=Microdochium trichocladiopsis TaxID=1682393 RepID=A0A9P8Y2Q6_9PEZI|nr:uncharacterized protein B0I36DRAFT_146374 [Microdochium trichocladiopsis]KAH7028021.1 hypothetical protein B0I36DRAFT_146374 [Microdochium trichocladiopsis]